MRIHFSSKELSEVICLIYMSVFCLHFRIFYFHISSMTVLRGSEVACSPTVDIERANNFMDFFRQRSMSIESGIQMPLSPLGRNLSGGSDSGDYSPPIVHFVSRAQFYTFKGTFPKKLVHLSKSTNIFSNRKLFQIFGTFKFVCKLIDPGTRNFF